MRRLLLVAVVFLFVAEAGAAEPDAALPPPTNLTVTQDASQGRVVLSWIPPSESSVTYSFNVYVNGQHVVSVTGTTATLNVSSGLVMGGIYQVTTVLDDAESLPATNGQYATRLGPCKMVSITVIPPTVNTHEQCIPDPIDYVRNKVQFADL